MNTRNLTAIVAAIFTLYLMPAAQADPGICRVTAGSAGAFKFAAIKCALKSDPENYRIRSTIWDSEDLEGYRDLARLAGRSFTCELIKGGTTSDGFRTLTTHYEMSDCR